MSDSEDSAEDHARLIAVEYGPTDKVWVGMVTKRAGDDRGGDGECGGMRRVLESVELEGLVVGRTVVPGWKALTQAVRSLWERFSSRGAPGAR